MVKSALKRINRRLDLPRGSRSLFLVVAVCASFFIAGTILIVTSRAAGPFVAAEPESGTLSNGASLVTDTSASNGKAVRFSQGQSPPSTIPSDCSTDAAPALITWINSLPNNTTVYFASGACYRVEAVLEFRNRSGLAFNGNGVTFRSLNAPDDQRAFWRFIDSANISFTNMTIDGSYTAGGTFSAPLQHAHAIDLRGTSATLSNLTMTDLAGDCVYFGLGYASTLTRSSGTLTDSSCHRIGRNAVSVTAGNDIRVERVTTGQVGFIVFDVEPNIGPGWGSERVVFNNNTIGTYYLHAYAMTENAPIRDQSFTNNRVVGQGLRIAAGPTTSVYGRPQNVIITGNSSDTPQRPTAISVVSIDGLTITGNHIPLTSGDLVHVHDSCYFNVSGNTYPGGTKELVIYDPRVCP